MSRDTSPDVQRRIDEHHRRMTPAEKAAALEEAWTTAIALQSAALRLEHPDASEADILDRIAAHRLGPELFAVVAAARAEARAVSAAESSRACAPRSQAGVAVALALLAVPVRLIRR